MKNHRSYRKVVLFIVLILFTATGVFTVLRQDGVQAQPEQAVKASWANLVRVGQYRFSTTITQTTYLAPSVQNVGHTSQQDVYHVSGETDLNGKTMQVSLWQNEGSALNAKDGIEIKADENEAQGRMIGGEWQPIDKNALNSFAPGNDTLSFLAAARNVQDNGSETLHLTGADGGAAAMEVTHYRFDIDSNRFAQYMRDQLTQELQRAGKLPLGMELDISEEYRQMVADGSLWVSSQGYPLRLRMTMQMPEQDNGQRVEAVIQTDFVQPSAQQLLALQAPAQRMMGWLGLSGSNREINDWLVQASICIVVAAIAVLMTLVMNRKVAYPVIAGFVILTMVVSPVWSGAKTSAFTTEVQAQQAQQEAAEQAKAEAEAQTRELITSTWDPHQLSPATDAAGIADDRSVLPGIHPSAALADLSAALRAEQAASEDSSDTDQDGLTDVYEQGFPVNVLNPALADTDSDGLNDRQEVRLALQPGDVDSDHDGIRDGVEVVPFDYADKKWYTNPGDNDTDKDGNADSAECPERVITEANPAPGICRDTDGDLTPDVFDTDDDNDSVPTYVDESPYTVSQNTYSKDTPFNLTISNLAQDVPVFITYQLRPVDATHLTYTMNVLDWPTGDVKGQIQRVSNSTFADENNMTAQELAQDSRAANGDMRLTPMVEIRFDPAGGLPLPLTDKFRFAISDPDYSATFSLTGKVEGGQSRTTVKVEQGPAGAYPIYVGRGNCEATSSILKVGNLDVSQQGDVSVALSQFADANYSIFIKDLSDQNTIACLAVPAMAHGSLANQVIDVTRLNAYGAFARNDFDGAVLVYSPLSLVYDYEGSVPVAFSMKVPYFNRSSAGVGAFDSTTQSLRVVWAINMLTDICKEIQPGYDENASGAWCDPDKPERWNKNIPRLIQTYPEEFSVTGLSVSEEDGVDLLAISENPAVDPNPNFDDQLWGMAQGLQSTFLVGRTNTAGNARDLTIDEIKNRFSTSSSIPAGDIRLWGLPKDAFTLNSYNYADSDGFIDFSMNQVGGVLDKTFTPAAGNPYPEAVTLLFAREQSQRVVTLDDNSAVCGAGACALDFNGQPLMTEAIVNWAPYRHTDQGWETMPSGEYLDLFEARLRGLSDFTPADSSDDTRAEVDGQVYMARMFYESMINGMAQLVAVNGTPLVSIPAVLDDQQIYDDFYQMNANAQVITKVFKTLTEAFVNGLTRNPSLMVAMVEGTRGASTGAFFKAIGKGLAQKVSSFTGLFKSVLARAIVGTLGVIAVVAVTASMVLYLMDSESTAGRIGGRILFASIGLLTAALAVSSLIQAYGWVKACKQVSAASQKAALVGMVIGIVITWGVFIAQWVISGVAIFSLAFNNMLADAIAATCTIILLAALSATGVGAIVVAIIALIDGLIATVCAAAGLNEKSEDSWERQYLCIGISGWITKIFKWAIYSSTYLIDYDNEERLAFVSLDQELRDVSAGMTAGNAMAVTIGVKNTIELSDIPFDWKAAVYFWQYSGSNARSAAFRYSITSGETDLHGGLNRGATSGWADAPGDDTWAKIFDAKTDGYSISLPPAGLNRQPSATLNEGSAVPVQECWAIPILWFLIPVCYIRTERNSIHVPVDASLIVDVLPATLDEFYSITPAGNGYTLDWGRDADLTFGTLKDADGDGLLSKAFPDGNDPDDSKYDTDGDTLSDRYEIANGLNLQNFDTDDDGLTDAEELAKNTDPLRKDTDGDGLPDKEEIQGWLFTYGFTADGTPLETMVYPNPIIPDGDRDGLTDLMEKIYGFNPNSPDEANILDYTLTTQELDSPLILLGLDETGGATAYADSSNFGYGAVCDGSNCPISGFAGRVGNAIHAVDSDPLRLPTSARTISLAGNRPFTLSAWVNLENNPDGELRPDAVILAKLNEQAVELIFSLTNGYPTLIGGGGDIATATCAVTPGQWNHVAVTFDGSTATFYRDGSACGSSAWSTPALAEGITPAEITVGGEPTGTVASFRGYLDEVGLFNRALSAQEVAERLAPANYNFNDTYVRPGEQITYQSQVSNLLQSRFAYGTVSTGIAPQEAVVNAENVLAPETFVLYPDNPVVTGVNTATHAETIQIDPAYATSGDLSITQTVEASVVDRRTESNMAEMWLKFDEGAATTQYEDSSGNMPPRTVTCGSSCSTSGAVGILNQAVAFTTGKSAALTLQTLSRMNLINHGYTISLWANAQSSTAVGTELTLLDTPTHRLKLALRRVDNTTYSPILTLNGSEVALDATASARLIQAGTWANLVVQYTGATNELKLYQNGTVVGVKTGTGAISAVESETLTLGAASTPVDYAIDDLRIFSRPLGDLDINRLAERPVLLLSMDNTFQDSSIYNQPVTTPKQAPVTSANAVRGTASMNPRSGGETGFLQVQGNAMLNFSDGAFTISTWVYPTANSSPTWQGIWGRRSNVEANGNAVDNNAFPTLERKGTQLRFVFGSGSTYETLTPVDALSENQWNHVVVTFQPGDAGKFAMKLYVNAVVKAAQLFNYAPSSSAASSGFFVGHSSSTTLMKVITVYMDNEHDSGTHAEVSVNESLNGGGWQEIYYHGNVADGDDLGLNQDRYHNGYENVTIGVIEDDGSSSEDDYCGGVTRYWYQDSDAGVGSAWLSDGFDGSMTYQWMRASLPFTGLIDEMQVYRYPLDSEQVFDLYSSVLLTADLPLDDRPATTSFENRAQVEDSFNGECTGSECPTAGVTGLIRQAARFDGENDRVSVDVKTSSDYMLSMWVNTVCPDCGLYQLSSSGATLSQVYLRSGNLCVKTGSTENCTRGGAIADNRWHHVAYANNGVYATLYLDGQSVNQLRISAAMPAAPSGSAVLGYAPAAARPYYSGQLDDVRVFHVSQGQNYVNSLLQRAPLFLAHLDETNPADGMQDSTLADWTLNCNQGGEGCPQGGLEGRLQTSLQFDGVNDAVSLVQGALSTTAKEFSVGLWVMPNNLLTHEQTLWSLANSQNGALKYAISIPANSMQLCVQSASAPACTASSAVELIQNVWNYVTLVVSRAGDSSENYALYINGYLDSTGSGSAVGVASDGLGKVTLGNMTQCADPANGCAFSGKLDEASIYTYQLNEIDVRDTFYYQMASVEETSSIHLTIDADKPSIQLVSYDESFPYLNAEDRMLQVNASDETSGIARVDMQVSHGGQDTFQTAPVCAESGVNSAFCPTFIPGDGDGQFLLTFRAVDRVGAYTSTQAVPLYVDNTGPRVVTDQVNGQLTAAQLHPSLENTWTVHLSGSAEDVILGDGSAGSGVDPDSLLVTLFSQAGEVVGAGSQKPTINLQGGKAVWSIDYLIPETEPTGLLTVRVEAVDKVGNHSQKEIGILLDASSSRSSLDSSDLPNPSAADFSAQSQAPANIYAGGIVTGSASDVPQDTGPYMSTDGEQAASSVTQVQVAFEPSMNVSYLYNQPYPDTVLAWLPLDNADVPVDANGQPDSDATTRYFVDISPYQLEGTCEGSSCPQAGIQGHVAGSMYFDGQNRSINLGQMVDLTNRSFTISSWVNLEAAGQNNPVVWQGPASIPQERVMYGFNAEDHFVCGFGGSDLVTPEAYPDGEWHAWACTYDLETRARRIYRDGVQVAADSAAPVPEMNENLYVGSAPSGSLNGYLDELLVLGQALDDASARSLYTGSQTIFNLGINEKFLTDGDALIEDSGFYGTAALSTGDGDALNKVGPGQVGDYSLNLDGSDRVKVDPRFNLALDRAAFSLAAWVHPTASGSDRDVISQRDENPERRYPSLILTADGKVRLGFGDGYEWLGVETDNSVAPDGTWTHLLATFDGSLMKLYVNGALAQSWDTLTGKAPYTSWQFNVGDGFTGMLDDVRIYPRPLGTLEAWALASTGWITADLQGAGNQVTWSVQTPSGLEGSYQIDTRAWDGQGHYDTGGEVQNQWGGVIDTLAPRLSLSRQPSPDDEYRNIFTFTVEDTMLDEASIRMNFCEQVDVEREYYNSPWYLTNGIAVNSALYRIHGTCEGPALTTEVTGFWACDTAGNCSAQTYAVDLPEHVYMPLVSSTGGAVYQPPQPPVLTDELRETAQTWPQMSVALNGDPQGPGPEIGLASDQIDLNNQRNPLLINLQGSVTDADGIARVDVTVYQGDSQVYAVQAAVVGEVWNAMWFHPAGNPPQDGPYRLVITATDRAGVQSTLTRDITVDLRP